MNHAYFEAVNTSSGERTGDLSLFPFFSRKIVKIEDFALRASILGECRFPLFYSSHRSPRVHFPLGSFSIGDGDGSENVTFKMNSRFFQTLQRLFQFDENVKCGRISLELISWGQHSSFGRERKIRCRLFTSSIKREIRDFHAVVVQ